MLLENTEERDMLLGTDRGCVLLGAICSKRVREELSGRRISAGSSSGSAS